MGGQADACQAATATQSSAATTVCPAGWRPPTGELTALNNAVNGGLTSTSEGLRSNFLAVYSGYYDNGLNSQGVYGYLWASTIFSTNHAHTFYFDSLFGVNVFSSGAKYHGFAVR